MPTAERNGSTVTTNADKTDLLYARWLEGPDRDATIAELRVLLMDHAKRVIYKTLRQEDPHLAQEMVDDLTLELDKFRGASRFSTWAHARFRYRAITELRYQIRSLGKSLDGMLDQAVEPAIEEQLLMAELQQRLTPKQQQVVQERLEGYSFVAIGKHMGITTDAAYWAWQQVLEGFVAQGRE